MTTSQRFDHGTNSTPMGSYGWYKIVQGDVEAEPTHQISKNTIIGSIPGCLLFTMSALGGAT